MTNPTAVCGLLTHPICPLVFTIQPVKTNIGRSRCEVSSADTIIQLSFLTIFLDIHGRRSPDDDFDESHCDVLPSYTSHPPPLAFSIQPNED